MIESQTLPPEAVDYLNNIDTEKENIKIEMDKEAAKTELLAHCNDFITKSAAWRKSSYEGKWEQYQRNADGIFDPAIAAKKEAWQSKVHVGITASHRETIHSHIFKTMVGVNPPLEISPRYDIGEQDQSDNIKDIMLREMDKARWGIEIDKVMNDADTFGSGFVRRSYKTTIEKRKLRKEQTESFTDDMNPMGMVKYAVRAATGNLKKSYQTVEEDVITYRGLCLTHVSIWDVFPDPKALKVRGTTIGCRYPLTYEEILKGIEDGYYLSSAATDLKDLKDNMKFAPGNDLVQADRQVTDSATDKTDYQQDYEAFEIFGRMPKKWIYTVMGEQFENGEELVPARIIFHKKCLIAVEINDDYEGEPTIDKMDYMPLNGSFYGMGVPAMLLAPQAVINEVVNQRLDAGATALNPHFAVIEKALVNPKEDLKSKAGMILRLDSKYVPNGNAANAIAQMQISDTPLRAGFSEVNEAERWAQERTSANRVTLGTAGLVNDSNKTLGGQQIALNSAGEKFAYIGLRMEIDFLQEFFRGIWKTIYNHIDPEDVEESIGPERAKTFVLVSPEEISRDYVYRPMGVFTMENKAMRTAQIMQLRQTFVGAPWLDDEKIFNMAAQSMDQEPEKFKKSEQQIMMDQAAQIQPGMGPEGQPQGSMPPVDTTGAPMPPQGMPSQVGQPTPPAEQGQPPSPDEIKAMHRKGTIPREMAVAMLKEHHGFN